MKKEQEKGTEPGDVNQNVERFEQAFPEGTEVVVVPVDAVSKNLIGTIAGKVFFAEKSWIVNVKSGEAEAKFDIERIRARSVSIKRIVKPLRVKLTDAERLEMGTAMSDALKKIEVLEDELSKIKKSFATDIETVENEVKGYGEKLRAGYEIRPMRVRVALDYDVGTATEFRDDTGEIISTRKLSPAECQINLPIDDGKKPEAAPGKK